MQVSLVTATGVPEFALTPEQTELLAKASAKVSRHFPSVLTPKQQDVMSLVACVGSIGYVQFRAYSFRKVQEAEAAKARENSAMPSPQSFGAGH